MIHLAILTLCHLNLFGILHPFHVSVCEMEYNSSTKSLEITYRMFLDDLESTLVEKYDTDLDITKPGQKGKVDKLVEEYLHSKFKFWANGAQVEFDYLGSEIEGYALWCFIEIIDLDNLETLAIDNKVMQELFDDQINLVHFNKEDQVRSLKLFKDHSFGTLKLKDLIK